MRAGTVPHVPSPLPPSPAAAIPDRLPTPPPGRPAPDFSPVPPVSITAARIASRDRTSGSTSRKGRLFGPSDRARSGWG